MKSDAQQQNGGAIASKDLFDVGLDDSERERLALLMEECAEVVQVVGKILRHGYESRHPNGGPTNREMLQTEIGHILAAKYLMAQAGDIDQPSIGDSAQRKVATVGKWLHFANTSNAPAHRPAREESGT